MTMPMTPEQRLAYARAIIADDRAAMLDVLDDVYDDDDRLGRRWNDPGQDWSDDDRAE